MSVFRVKSLLQKAVVMTFLVSTTTFSANPIEPSLAPKMATQNQNAHSNDLKSAGVVFFVFGGIAGLVGVAAEFDGRNNLEKAQNYRRQYDQGQQYYSVVNGYNTAYDKVQTGRTVRDVSYWIAGTCAVFGTAFVLWPESKYKSSVELTPRLDGGVLAFKGAF